MKTQHTPGPWIRSRAVDNSEDVHICSADRDGKPNGLIATCNAMISWNPATRKSEEMEANARLIALAPEMHTALLEADRVLSFHFSKDHPSRADIRALLAKL